MRKFFCYQCFNGSRPAHGFWCDITDGLVNGEDPVEDFGMYMILNEEISVREMEGLFIALLGNDEDPDYTPQLYKDDVVLPCWQYSHLDPQRLTKRAMRIYNTLTG